MGSLIVLGKPIFEGSELFQQRRFISEMHSFSSCSRFFIITWKISISTLATFLKCIMRSCNICALKWHPQSVTWASKARKPFIGSEGACESPNRDWKSKNASLISLHVNISLITCPTNWLAGITVEQLPCASGPIPILPNNSTLHILVNVPRDWGIGRSTQHWLIDQIMKPWIIYQVESLRNCNHWNPKVILIDRASSKAVGSTVLKCSFKFRFVKCSCHFMEIGWHTWYDEHAYLKKSWFHVT